MKFVCGKVAPMHSIDIGNLDNLAQIETVLACPKPCQHQDMRETYRRKLVRPASVAAKNFGNSCQKARNYRPLFRAFCNGQKGEMHSAGAPTLRVRSIPFRASARHCGDEAPCW